LRNQYATPQPSQQGEVINFNNEWWRAASDAEEIFSGEWSKNESDRGHHQRGAARGLQME
jgi:hypothetical protein